MGLSYGGIANGRKTRGRPKNIWYWHSSFPVVILNVRQPDGGTNTLQHTLTSCSNGSKRMILVYNYISHSS